MWRIIEHGLPTVAVYLWVKSWMLSMGSYLKLERSCLEDSHLWSRSNRTGRPEPQTCIQFLGKPESRCKAKSWIRELQTPQLPDTHLELVRDTKHLDRYTGIVWMHELTLKSHQCITNSETLQKACLLYLCCMSLKGRYEKFPKWSWEKCVCVRELMRFMWGWLSTDSPGLSHLCVGVFFFPPWDHLVESVVKNKKAAEDSFFGRGAGLDCSEALGRITLMLLWRDVWAAGRITLLGNTMWRTVCCHRGVLIQAQEQVKFLMGLSQGVHSQNQVCCVPVLCFLMVPKLAKAEEPGLVSPKA